MEGGARNCGRAENRSQRRADAWRPGDPEGGSGHYRPAGARSLQESLDVPLTVELRDEEGADEENTHGDDQPGGDLLEEQLVVLQRAADAGGSQAQEDEDRREARDEEQARDQDAAPIGLVEVRQCN